MIQQQRELKMTRICPTCGDQYGLWRPRCPSCGDHNERRAAAVSAPVAADIKRKREARERKAIVAVVNGCIECRRRVKGRRIKGGGRMKPSRCEHCDEPIHGECLRLHAASCRKFQVELQAEIARR